VCGFVVWLGHGVVLSVVFSFVSTFVVLPLHHPVIVSGGLGAELMLWNLYTGSELARFDLTLVKPGAPTTPAATAVARHEGAGAHSSAAATTTAASIAESAAQSCYISAIQLLSLPTDADMKLSVTVYPWPHIFLLTYTPASLAHFAVDAVIDAPTTPMCLGHAHGAAASAPSGSVQPRLYYIDQQLEMHALAPQQAKDGKAAADFADASAEPVVAALLSSCNTAFATARASLADTLITDASDFLGEGSEHQQQGAEAKPAAAASSADRPPGRYISPFSSTAHSTHLFRLSLLQTGGFAFRRFFDKLQRERYVSAKKAEVAARRLKAKANRKQKNGTGAAAAATEEDGAEGEGMDD